MLAESIFWPRHMRGGRGINTLVAAPLTDSGGGSIFQCNLVEVVRVATSERGDTRLQVDD